MHESALVSIEDEELFALRVYETNEVSVSWMDSLPRGELVERILRGVNASDLLPAAVGDLGRSMKDEDCHSISSSAERLRRLENTITER